MTMADDRPKAHEVVTQSDATGAVSEAVTEEQSGFEDLTRALEAAEARAIEAREQYLRVLAELDNVRKRSTRDVENAHKFALERFASELLGVKDSLEMGLAAAGSADVVDPQRLLEGTEATLRQLTRTFEKFGLTEINPLGQRFDPQEHEAMATQPSIEHEPDSVLEVVQKGYMLNGRLLRPARVLVSRAPDPEA